MDNVSIDCSDHLELAEHAYVRNATAITAWLCVNKEQALNGLQTRIAKAFALK